MGYDLRSGNTKSCGCRKSRTTHGYGGTLLYKRWYGLLQRCYNPNIPNYRNYGARGVQVCKRWHDFQNFLDDMGHPPTKLSIERLNNNGHYSCGKCEECLSSQWTFNCKWVSRLEQNTNKRTNRFVTAFEQTKTVAEWSHFSGLAWSTIKQRLDKGVPPEEALTKPGRRRG